MGVDRIMGADQVHGDLMLLLLRLFEHIYAFIRLIFGSEET